MEYKTPVMAGVSFLLNILNLRPPVNYFVSFNFKS